MSKVARLQITMPEETVEKLEALRGHLDISFSELISRALNAYAERIEAEEDPSE